MGLIFEFTTILVFLCSLPYSWKVSALRWVSYKNIGNVLFGCKEPIHGYKNRTNIVVNTNNNPIWTEKSALGFSKYNIYCLKYVDRQEIHSMRATVIAWNWYGSLRNSLQSSSMSSKVIAFQAILTTFKSVGLKHLLDLNELYI